MVSPPAEPAITRIGKSGSGLSRIPGLRLRRRLFLGGGEEALEKNTDASQVTTDLNAGETLQQVGSGFAGRARDPE